MDDITFQSHFRLTRQQFDILLCNVERIDMNNRLLHPHSGGIAAIPVSKELLIFLWYLANENSMREISDKFNIARSSAFKVIVRMIAIFRKLAPEFIREWTEEEKVYNSAKFKEVTGLDNVVGAIDGCHIKITRPARHGEIGDDYSQS